MQDAGIRVTPDPIEITGRILPPPSLVFGDNEVDFLPISLLRVSQICVL
jgi:hypothetical protein